MSLETIHINSLQLLPEDYHCTCEFCQKFLGVLQRPDGSKYSRLERRAYYSSIDKKHFAKTPLHLARWAIQQFSKPGDWVLDPTMGAGTTAVESLRQGRNVVGAEIQFIDVIDANIAANNPHNMNFHVQHMDARGIGTMLDEHGFRFQLVVNNPPYSGDQQAPKGYSAERRPDYNTEFHNLAFAKEGPQYWADLEKIYSAALDHLEPGGHFVIGVKDMMRNKQPYLLHKMLCDLMVKIGGTNYVGMALLPHYPTTLFMNTYKQFYGVGCPMYQTINVFQKKHEF